MVEQSKRDYFFRQCIETFYNFIIVDGEGRIVFVNHHYSQVLGIPQDQVVGRRVDELIPNTRMLKVLESGEAEIGSIMTLFDHSQGKEVTVVCNRRPIWDGGRLIGVMAETTNRDLNEVETLYNKIHLIQAENHRYKAQLEALTVKKGPLDAIVGHAPCLMEVKKSILDYAASGLPILFTGETGTGKELFSNAAQQLSERSRSSFVKVNCAAIPKDLMEAEFFGYEEGAFTGARKGGKPGKIELADGGTLFLDEVGELPMSLQAKLLRVLQESELERVGGVAPITVDVRILCSTNQDLEQMVGEGTFRGDLYYRINTVELHIPPLRERLEDLPLLCTRFIYEINQGYGFQISGISPGALEVLSTHSWPGNVRELKHVIERAGVLCKSGALDVEHLAFFHPKGTEGERRKAEGAPGSLTEQRAQTEREAIAAALRKTGGNKAKAARLLHIDRSNLYAKLKKYGIEPE